jgi:hypothetical protein
VRIEGGRREECRADDAGDDGNGLPEIGCRPSADEAPDKNGNRGGGKGTGGSDPHAPSSVLSRERNGSHATKREAQSVQHGEVGVKLDAPNSQQSSTSPFRQNATLSSPVAGAA